MILMNPSNHRLRSRTQYTFSISFGGASPYHLYSPLPSDSKEPFDTVTAKLVFAASDRFKAGYIDSLA